MVTVRQQVPVTADGRIDLQGWADALAARLALEYSERLRAAASLAERAESAALAADHAWSSGVSGFETGLEMAEILVQLRLDEEAIVAALLYRAVREGHLAIQAVGDQFGERVVGLIDGVQRMAAISELQLDPTRRPLDTKADQIDNVRKMLVGLVDDVRVALIKLAERTCAIRAVKDAPDEKRERVAKEVFNVYAPLAHRLGIGQLRWELEDLSFRYLEAADYKRIATLLNERRQERQQWIDSVAGTLEAELERAGIPAEVQGRAKHIYSIWRKMRQKGVAFDQLYDVRAVRILVDELRYCYAALGIVHSLWRHIPHEFDDYIANPKGNGYRSIHTAVLGPDGRTLEVQIRSHEMHVEAELGVCSHWAYKGSEVEGDEVYEAKMAWLRNVLDWQEELGDPGELAADLREEFQQQRIYLLTPGGDVVDLIPGATPIDFAYRIHTEVGHRCRGARVDGRVVRLNHPLVTGEKVEIVTDPLAEPHRDWLNPDLGYVKSARARSRIQSYFRARDRRRNRAEGRAVLEREINRLALPRRALARLVEWIGRRDIDDLAQGLGAGEVGLDRVRAAAQTWLDEQAQRPELPQSPTPEVEIRGVGNLDVYLSECCQPHTREPIVGFVMSERAVAIHQADCRELMRRYGVDSEHLLAVSWSTSASRAQRFRIRVDAYDRAGLLRDVSAVLAEAQLDVVNTTASSDRDRNRAMIHIDVELENLQQLGAVMDRISEVTNVLDVSRERSEA